MAEDDYEVMHSPLELTLCRDQMRVAVRIFRGEDEDSWTLELAGGDGGSTVWEDTFPTDRAAFDAAMRAIADEGLAPFARVDGRVLH